jgi:hypothetical protein
MQLLTSLQVPHLKFMVDFVTTMMRAAHRGADSKNVRILTDFFDERSNKEAFFCQSITYARSKIRQDEPLNMASFEDRQASAKLHTYFGVPIRSLCRTKYKLSYPYAVSMVYDMRNYTNGTLWGPFLPDGRATVDWEKMEAVMVVLGHNLREFTTSTNGIFRPLWTSPWHGVSPNSYKSIPLKRALELPTEPNFEDPYNITGSWMRVSCPIREKKKYRFFRKCSGLMSLTGCLLPWYTPPILLRFSVLLRSHIPTASIIISDCD